jgi:SAM-dependent methyltransferase
VSDPTWPTSPIAPTDPASPASPNAESIEVWNRILVPKFTRYRHILAAGFAGHSRAALDALGPRPGDRVLDVGCGFGETSLELGARVGPTGAVLGIDCCQPFLDVARDDAARAGAAQVTFRTADAQAERFEADFDLCFSRFGTMFFQNPGAAMRNLGAALRPRGRLLMLVWRRIEDNDWCALPKAVARAHLPPPPELAPSCGPGPFSMSDPETLTAILTAAGFTQIALRRIDVPVMVGRTIDEAIEFQLQIGPAGEIVRDAGAEGQAKRPLLSADLRRLLARYETPDGVVMPSSSWSVAAHGPQWPAGAAGGPEPASESGADVR